MDNGLLNVLLKFCLILNDITAETYTTSGGVAIVTRTNGAWIYDACINVAWTNIGGTNVTWSLVTSQGWFHIPEMTSMIHSLCEWVEDGMGGCKN